MKRHRASAQIQERAKQLRQEQTASEASLWQELRAHRLGGYKFRRQHPIGRFIVDFYCAERRLIIELDGSIHDQQQEYDHEREELLLQQGYTIIRIANAEIEADLAGVLQRILDLLSGLPEISAN
jgi:very-short-patch-repair endonuclease